MRLLKIEWRTCLRVGITVLLVYLAIRYVGVVQNFLMLAVGAAAPIIIGCVIAYILNIVMTFYEKHYFPATKKKFLIKSRRIVCLFMAVVSLIAIIVLVVSLILPQLISCIQLLITQIPGAIEICVDFLDDHGYITDTVMNEISKINWNEKIQEVWGLVSSYFGNVVNLVINLVTSIFSGVISALLSIIFSFYLLISKDRLSVQINKLIDSYLKPKMQKKVRYISKVFNESFHNYIVGQCTEAVILGLLCTIGMTILGLPYATMIGALAAFTALIPIFGAFIGAIVGAFMIFMVSPLDALIFLVFIIILQQLESNIIYPRVVGSSIGLPAIWVLVAVTIGGGVFGIPGMLVGVPLVASVYRIVRHDVRKRIKYVEAQKEQQNAE